VNPSDRSRIAQNAFVWLPNTNQVPENLGSPVHGFRQAVWACCREVDQKIVAHSRACSTTKGTDGIRFILVSTGPKT